MLAKTQAIFAVYRWTTATLSMSFAIQFSATSLIVWKIWRTTAWTESIDGHKERLAIIWMIVESGAIMTALTVTVLALFLLHMNVSGVIASVIVQISVCISFRSPDSPF